LAGKNYLNEMRLEQGKEKFIESWGKMATDWGINRTMAQVHALLLIAQEPMTADGVMEALHISRGNANMNLRALMDWGLVHKQLRAGERKEFFVAEKEMWTVVKQIIIHRKKKELEPMIRVLDELSGVTDDSPEAQEFRTVVRDIQVFSHKANQTLDTLIKADSNWFTNIFLRMVR
jgi:DNA-binding transcriptional regulator GbsR (MarR family)